MKALLIYSGGLDSTTLLYEYRDCIALAVSFDYGSKHNAREIAYAKLHCNRLGIKHMILPLDFIGKYFRSDLLIGGGEIPEGSYDDGNMRSTVVPFRNGIMLAVAAGLAESYGLDTLLIANHSGDHAIYPDCRPQFADAMGKAIEAGTYEGITLDTPYTHLSKADIVKRGVSLGVDYTHTWSCYKGQQIHCGKCGTCRERKEAFALAGIADTTHYEE